MKTKNDSSLVISGAPETQPSDPPETDVYVFPCSVVQRTCWFLDQMSPGTAVNNIAVRFRLTGALQPDLLEQALNEIARRHEVLRTRFIVRDGEPMQLVESDLAVQLPVLDLLSIPDAAELEAATEARLPFDVAKGPLWRTRLLRIGAQEFILLITIHHIIADGWSIGIIVDELGQIYGSLAEGSLRSLPPLSIQYADYASWQNESLSSKLEAELDYWSRRLHDFQPLCIPVDHARPAKALNRGNIQSTVLPRAVTDALKKLSDQQGCTLFMTMLAAFQVLMRHESGQSDIVLRTQTAGRGRVELEPLIGWFVNSVLLRVEVTGAASFLDLLQRTKQDVLDALDHQHVPFEQVIEVVHPRQDQSHRLPFPVNFIFQRDFVKAWTRGGVTLTAAPSAAAGTFVDLNFFLVERVDGWRASLDVNTDVFSPATGEFLLRAFQTIVETVAANPHIRIADIKLPKRSGAILPEHAPALSEYVGARTQLEQDVVSIWEQVLHVKPIGVLTNFFDLGGHSLLAVQVISKIQAKFGHSVGIADIFQDPTVAAMARMLAKDEGDGQLQPIIPVQPAGTRPPFFMIGGDHWFRPLAVHCGLDQPFLGVPLVRYRHLNIEESRAEIAGEIAEMLLAAYPGGPYFLGGWCADGITAYEVARAIESRGGTVGLLVEFDAMSPDYFRGMRSVLSSTSKAATGLGNILQTSIRKGVVGAVASIGSQVGVVLSKASERIRYIVSSNYTCPEASFPILVLRPGLLSSMEDPELGWRTACPEKLAVEEVPGDHSTIFKEPNVRSLAQSLRKHLDLQLEVLPQNNDK